MTLHDSYNNSELFSEMWIEFNQTIYGEDAVDISIANDHESAESRDIISRI